MEQRLFRTHESTCRMHFLSSPRAADDHTLVCRLPSARLAFGAFGGSFGISEGQIRRFSMRRAASAGRKVADPPMFRNSGIAGKKMRDTTRPVTKGQAGSASRAEPPQKKNHKKDADPGFEPGYSEC